MAVDRRFLDVRLTIDGVVTAPVKTAVGTQYLVAATGATGDFAGQEGKLAYRAATGWKFYSNFSGQLELFNLDDNKIYRYEIADGETDPSWGAHSFGVDDISDRITGPVLAVRKTGTALPATCEKDDIFVDVLAGKVHVATAADTWDAGTAASEGDRYASSTDHKIYTFDGEDFVGVAVADGAMFLSKEDDNIYSYDATSGEFVNLTSAKDNVKRTITVTHTITAEEVTAKGFDLPKLAVLADGVLCSLSGVVQTPAADYTVANANDTSTLSWDGLGLEPLVMAGDVAVLSYNTEQA